MSGVWGDPARSEEEKRIEKWHAACVTAASVRRCDGQGYHPEGWIAVGTIVVLALVVIQAFRYGAGRSCRPAVVVVQSTQHGDGDDGRSRTGRRRWS